MIQKVTITTEVEADTIEKASIKAFQNLELGDFDIELEVLKCQ